MTRSQAPDPYLDAKLLGILLSGVFGHTRPECSPLARPRVEAQPSGIYRIVLPEMDDQTPGRR